MIELSQQDQERFYAKIVRQGPDDCWPWTACRDECGYGRIYLQGKARRSHRVAYFLATGHWPGGLCVLHSCDNPACCNPAHLRAGTQADNVWDMVERKRSPRGEKHHTTTLTDESVLEILDQFKCPYWGQSRDIAKRYGVSQYVISFIKTGKNWGHLQAPIRRGESTSQTSD